MDLGTCRFSPQQKGRATLSDDGKSAIITPSGGVGDGEFLEKWLKGVGGDKVAAMKEATEPVTLHLVSATNGGEDLLRLAKAGTLVLGVDRETGHFAPARLKCFTKDCSVVVAEFAAKGGK